MKVVMFIFILALVVVENIRTAIALKKAKEIDRLIKEDIEKHKSVIK